MGSPAYHVHAGGVDGEFEDLGPGCGGGLGTAGGESVAGCFTPDEDFAVVGGGGEEGAEFRVGLDGRGEQRMKGDRGEGERTHETHHTAPSCLVMQSQLKRVVELREESAPL